MYNSLISTVFERHCTFLCHSIHKLSFRAILTVMSTAVETSHPFIILDPPECHVLAVETSHPCCVMSTAVETSHPCCVSSCSRHLYLCTYSLRSIRTVVKIILMRFFDYITFHSECHYQLHIAH